MEYNFSEVEQRWQKHWADKRTFAASNRSDKPKYYVLDMFPYPSGSGLHVGHPLGYIASDIYARYKRHCGFNVLHPMGYDAFGLPAEQYAIQTGQHPAVTTENNIKRYREQLDKIGFSFDWDRQVKTSDPGFYKWTQWIFVKLFHSWYNLDSDKAQPIETLIEEFKKNGNTRVRAACDPVAPFSAGQWNGFSNDEQREVLLNYRIAYRAETMVNWCPALGTVLANDEVVNGVSERGGHPVELRKMRQWSLRITAYAQRLLDGLDTVEWSESLKEIQRNWIGRSEGAEIDFPLNNSEHSIKVFTTRPDTVFGATFMVLAPEHELVEKITTREQASEIGKYLDFAKTRSERERMAEVKQVTGAFTGAYATNPITGRAIPVWISDYVLAGYGTGAIMAVPAGDQRDWDFARHFNLDIIPVIEGQDVSKEADERKDGTMINSGFLDGKTVKEAIAAILQAVEEKGIGKRKVNYKLRDAVFSRQRYWGEPFPVYYRNDIPYTMDEDKLPLLLPEIDEYKPTETGEPPLGRATHWNWDREAGKVVKNGKGYPIELSTMPGWAGSSWYYLCYMMEGNEEVRAKEFVSEDVVNYWRQVDLYIGGAEHSTGHLLYFRFWTKFLYDLGYIPFEEPAKRLINQGMIQGVSMIAKALIKGDEYWMIQPTEEGDNVAEYHFPVKYVSFEGGRYFIHKEGLELTKREFPERADFYMKDDKVELMPEVEKMSKSKLNAINPDDVIKEYGTDALRLHEMFLGPIEMHKPWNTKGIDGVSRFMRKLWRLYHHDENSFYVSEEAPTKEELKILHKCIHKVTGDMEKLAFNTSVSAFMVAVNELTDQKCYKRAILEPLAILVSCHSPHIAEELWMLLGHGESITNAPWPAVNEEYLKEDTISYPVSFNGKTRYHLELPVGYTREQVEKEVVENDLSQKWLEGKPPKKVIVVPGRIVNVVV